ncbi:hypothetical protein AB1287_18370 [Enterobacter asburiae]|uniref:hypothetical protein n=1 Tax=unclassified Scandinavium TaxID=2830652 RepID=UPI00289910C5|nr:hypothetical protein [Scandinavium sp.]
MPDKGISGKKSAISAGQEPHFVRHFASQRLAKVDCDHVMKKNNVNCPLSSALQKSQGYILTKLHVDFTPLMESLSPMSAC